MPKTHDSLFQKTFSIPEETASVLRVHLPAEIAAAVDWFSLVQDEGTFVDDGLTQRHSDLLFSCRYSGRDALLYILYEHQSTEDPVLPYRLAEYIVRILRRDQDRQPRSEPRPVIPVVLAQTGSHWNLPTRFSDLFATTLVTNPQLRAAHLDFLYHVVDLSLIDAVRPTIRPAARLTLHLMKFAREPGTPLRVALRADLWLPVPPTEQEAFWHYLFSLRHLDKHSMKSEILSMENEALRATGLSFAEHLLAEGKAEGKAEGRAEQARTGVLRCVQTRFGEVPYPLEEFLAAESSLERLDAALVAAIRADSLESLLGTLGLQR
jgi:predicted transposase YdaD